MPTRHQTAEVHELPILSRHRCKVQVVNVIYSPILGNVLSCNELLSGSVQVPWDATHFRCCLFILNFFFNWLRVHWRAPSEKNNPPHVILITLSILQSSSLVTSSALPMLTHYSPCSFASQITHRN